jgi:sigma-B regulation protein RsbU (phosphoserine phosphatase)
MEYDTQSVPLGPFARLLVYSDGVFEVEQPDGRMWKLDEFIQYVSGLPREEPAAERMLAHVRRLGRAAVLADDFSFLEVRF